MSVAQTTVEPCFGAGLSTRSNWSDAVAEACAQAAATLTAPADLAVAFLSPHHAEAAAAIAAELRTRLGARCLLGSTGVAIVGTGREVENQPALSVWGAQLPGVTLIPMQLQFAETPEGSSFLGFPDELLDGWPASTTLLLLADPWTFPADGLLARLNNEAPGLQIIGGMASGGMGPGENRLFAQEQVLTGGAVGVALHGPLRVNAVVSQGCRPIGRPMVITKSHQNIIESLGGRPALAQLQAIYAALSPDEQQLLRQGAHVGRVVNEYQSEFGRGDFLVRNVLDVEHESGAIAIGDFVRPGQTVQFHLRDAETADEDLRALLERAKSSVPNLKGGLLFTCNGRGTRLFGRPDHDAALVQQQLGSIPLAGFFAQGEIGPIGGKSFLHGFTASIALFSSLA